MYVFIYGLKKKYPEFVYHGYEIGEDDSRVGIVYDFEIPGLASFHPTWEFPKKPGETRCFRENGTFRKLAFSLGMVELISYWKTACPPVVTVEAGSLDGEQILWWKDLYFNGLGEFYYTNGIEENQEDFMEIRSAGALEQAQDAPLGPEAQGYLVPVGGGKDSAVTLSLLEGRRRRTAAISSIPGRHTEDGGAGRLRGREACLCEAHAGPEHAGAEPAGLSERPHALLGDRGLLRDDRRLHAGDPLHRPLQ